MPVKHQSLRRTAINIVEPFAIGYGRPQTALIYQFLNVQEDPPPPGLLYGAVASWFRFLPGRLFGWRVVTQWVLQIGLAIKRSTAGHCITTLGKLFTPSCPATT